MRDSISREMWIGSLRRRDAKDMTLARECRSPWNIGKPPRRLLIHPTELSQKEGIKKDNEIAGEAHMQQAAAQGVCLCRSIYVRASTTLCTSDITSFFLSFPSSPPEISHPHSLSLPRFGPILCILLHSFTPSPPLSTRTCFKCTKRRTSVQLGVEIWWGWPFFMRARNEEGEKNKSSRGDVFSSGRGAAWAP